MTTLDQLEKQRQKLEQAVKDKKQKDKLEQEIREMQEELKGNGKRKEKLKGMGMKIVNVFDAFERFADRHGSDGSELDEFIGGDEPKKKGKKKGKKTKKEKKASVKIENIMIFILFMIMKLWL